MNVASFLGSHYLCIFPHYLSVGSCYLSLCSNCIIWPILLCCPCCFPFLLFSPLLCFFSSVICGVEAKASHMLGENSASDLHLSFYISILNSTQRFAFCLNYIRKICAHNKIHVSNVCVCVYMCACV